MILQAGSAIPSTPVELILSSSMATKVVLAILAMLSLCSWAIILAKWLEFRRVAARGVAFMAEFSRVAKLDQAAALAKRTQAGPQTRLAIREIGRAHV